MNSSLIQLTFVCLLLLVSCTPASLLEVETSLPPTVTTARIPDATFSERTRTITAGSNFTGNTTLALSVAGSTVSAETGNLVVDFSGSGDLSQVQLKEQQSLELLDSDEQPYTQSFTVLSYTATEQNLRVEFALGRSSGEDPALQEQQSIIVVDIIVN